jgi:GDPmannose 4,6-dehydratase
MTNRALITGITGQDGSYLAELLVSKGYYVAGLARTDVLYSALNLENLRSVEGKVVILQSNLENSTPEMITRTLKLFKPTEVYNLAGMSFSPDCEKDPIKAAEINGVNAVKLMEAIKQYDPKIRMFQASSSEMYGPPRTTPQTEDTPFNPTTVYGVAKLYAHNMARYYRDKGLYISCGILYSHESPRRKPEFVVRKICQAAARISKGLQDKLELGYIDVYRDWSYAPEVVEGMWKSLQAKTPDDYIFAFCHSHSVREMCEAAFGVVGLDYTKYVVSAPYSVKKAINWVGIIGDNSKAKKVLKWEPKVGFTDIAKIMVEADLKLLEGGRSG